jgi:hypothetical protein
VSFFSVVFLQAKQEIFEVKQHRLALAQDEYRHLNSALNQLSASHTSRKNAFGVPFLVIYVFL